MPFSTQKAKDEHDAKMREVYKNLPTPDRPKSNTEDPRPAKPKRKFRKPETGFKLGDVMPQELKNTAYAYRRRQKRAKLRELNNKGDQYYGRNYTGGERASNSQNQR